MDLAILSPDAVKERAERCWRSPSEFARVYLPTWFPSKMPWVHRGICALRIGRADWLLDFGEEWWPEDVARGEPSRWTRADLIKVVTNFVIEREPAIIREGKVIKPAVLDPMFQLQLEGDRIIGVTITQPNDLNSYILPRGFAKTTLMNMLNLRDIVFREAGFILYVSESDPHASNQVLTVRNQLTSNDLLINDFGDVKPARTDDETWSAHDFETTTGQRLVSKGRGGQIRGQSKDARRPTRIVVDDLQDEESVESPTQRTKDVNWVLRSLLPARQLFGAKPTKVDFVGTLLHPESVMGLQMNDEEYTRVRFGAYDRQGEPLWPYAMDRAKIEKLRDSYASRGKLDIFDYEYNSSVPLDDGVKFPTEKIIYINRPADWFAAKCVVADPAISENPKADFFCASTLGIGKFGDIHTIDFFGKVGVDFDDQAEKFFEFHFAHCLDLPPDRVVHGIEAVAYQRSLISLIKTKQAEKSKTWGMRAYFEVVPILHGKTGKKMRIQGNFSPRVKSGHFSCERQFPLLLSQLQQWGQPNAKDDAPDCVSMGIGLLDPYAGFAAMEPDPENDNEPVLAAPGVKLPPLAQVLGGRTFRHAP